MSVDDHTENMRRAAAAEVSSRARNERIRPDPEAGWDLGLVRRRCECGNPGCTDTIGMTVAEYEQLREHATRFAVADAHVFAEVEMVVSREARYTVVEKQAEAAAIAVAQDPRS